MPRFERHGAVPGAGRASEDNVHVATDAVVVAASGIFGLAFLASNGSYGMRLGDQPRMPLSDAVGDAKLRAISFAMKRNPALPHPVTIASDSLRAVGMYNLWQENPESPHLPPLFRELRLSADGRDRYTFAWSPGGGEDPLAEWADSAARLALRIESGIARRRDASAMLDQWARARLHDWSHARKD